MEIKLQTRKIGGSICIIIPKEVAERERIGENESVNVRIEKSADLKFLWGKLKGVKKSTKKIMEEIDEGENEQ